VSLRSRKEGNIGVMPFKELVEKLREEVEAKA
jgi:threonyl-tRNA synthetase